MCYFRWRVRPSGVPRKLLVGALLYCCLLMLLSGCVSVLQGVGGTTAQATLVAITATPTPTPPQIALAAQGRLIHGQRAADLSWSGATSNRVDVYRDGVLIITTRNDGFYTDRIGGTGTGTFTYQVCNQGTQTCSNQATVTF